MIGWEYSGIYAGVSMFQLAARLSRGEIHVRHLLDRRRHAEKIAFGFEAEQVCHEVARKGFALVAIVAHVAVVKPARGLDAILGVDQFLLQLEKILIGLELRIIL